MRYLAIASAAALAALIASAHAVALRANAEAPRPMTTYLTKMAQAPAPVEWLLRVRVSVGGEEVGSYTIATMTPTGPASVTFESEDECRSEIAGTIEQFTPTIRGRFGDNAEVKVSCEEAN